MAYAIIADFRAQGIPESLIDDAALQPLIDEACADIERYTKWWFEPRARTFELDGRGVPTLETPQVPIDITEVTIDDGAVPEDLENVEVYGGPLEPSETDIFPRVVRSGSSFRVFARRRLDHRLCGPPWPRGCRNIRLVGTWGYTEADGTPLGKTPAAIKRVTIMMVVRNLPLLGNPEHAAGVQDAWRVRAKKTRDQQVTFGRDFSSGIFGSKGAPFTGDPRIDEILLRFLKPGGMGAV